VKAKSRGEERETLWVDGEGEKERITTTDTSR